MLAHAAVVVCSMEECVCVYMYACKSMRVPVCVLFTLCTIQIIFKMCDYIINIMYQCLELRSCGLAWDADPLTALD